MRSVPIIPIRGAVVFPHTDTLLSFARSKSVTAADEAFAKDRLVAIFTQKDSRIGDPEKEDLFEIGTIATITQMMSVEDGVKLAIEAIKSSTQRDIASGNGIDVVTITKDGIKHVVQQEIVSEYRDDKK